MNAKDSRQFILLNAGIAEHHSDWNWDNVSSPFARLYMVREGEATVHMPNGAQKVVPGYIYLIPPFTLHRYECDGYFSLYYFHIYENLSTPRRVLEEYNFPFGIEARELESMLIQRLLEINPNRELHKYDPSSYDNNDSLQSHLKKNLEMPYPASMETDGIINILISRFVASYSKKQDISDSRISKAVSYIRKNIDNEITIEELSSYCYMSKDHFIRLFKKEVGTTPLQYINLRKIEKAQLLLISTEFPVKNIAQALSFSNLSNFNRLFRQTTGTTPIRYRNRSDL